MYTYVYYIAEKIPGAMEMQRFAHPIHVGIVSASDHEAAYSAVLEDLRPTFADAPQPLEVRFEVVTPPKSGTGVCATASRTLLGVLASDMTSPDGVGRKCRRADV